MLMDVNSKSGFWKKFKIYAQDFKFKIYIWYMGVKCSFHHLYAESLICYCVCYHYVISFAGPSV